MKYLQNFESEASYQNTEDIHVSKVGSSGVKFDKAKPATPLTSIPVGYNLRGKTIYNSRLDLSYKTPTGKLSTQNASPTGYGLEVGTLQYGGGGQGLQYYAGNGPGNRSTYYQPQAPEGSRFAKAQTTVPDDRDYIVSANTLVPSTDGTWGYQYVMVE